MSKAIILGYVVTTSLALILLRLGSKDGAPVSFVENKLVFNITLLTTLGVMLFTASFLLYTYLLSIYELGYIIPLVTGLVYVFIFAASYFIFNEKFTTTKILAILLIIIGVALINAQSSSTIEVEPNSTKSSDSEPDN